MKCVFVPDNILMILCEEQSLFQGLLDFRFYETIPYCPVEIETKDFESLEILPPESYNDIIVRKCFGVMKDVAEMKFHVGNFVLGNAREFANKILEQTKSLKSKSRKAKIFEVLTCKVRYTAEFEIKQSENLTAWEIKNIKWEK